RRRLLIGTTIMTSATLILAFVLTVLGLVRIPHLLVLAALSSTFRAFDEPSRMALVPQLVEPERLPNAIALGSIPWQARRMIGTLIIATLTQRMLRPGTVMLTAAVCMGLALMMFSRSPGMGLAMPMLALVGFCSTFYLTHVTTIIQQKVPDHLRGRVLSLYSLCWNLLPLGGLLAGALAAAVDARFAVLVGGAMVAANALVLITSRRLRAVG